MLPSGERRAGKDPGIGWSREISLSFVVMLLLWLPCMIGILSKNALTANRSSNSLLTSLPLIKCFLLHPTFLDVWKSRHQSLTGSFPARLLLSGEKPWERGCILAETRWHLCMLICRRFTRVVWKRICYAFVACSFACVAKISSCNIKLSTAFDTCRWVSLDQSLY